MDLWQGLRPIQMPLMLHQNRITAIFLVYISNVPLGFYVVISIHVCHFKTDSGIWKQYNFSNLLYIKIE